MIILHLLLRNVIFSSTIKITSINYVKINITTPTGETFTTTIQINGVEDHTLDKLMLVPFPRLDQVVRLNFSLCIYDDNDNIQSGTHTASMLVSEVDHLLQKSLKLYADSTFEFSQLDMTIFFYDKPVDIANIPNIDNKDEISFLLRRKKNWQKTKMHAPSSFSENYEQFLNAEIERKKSSNAENYNHESIRQSALDLKLQFAGRITSMRKREHNNISSKCRTTNFKVGYVGVGWPDASKADKILYQRKIDRLKADETERQERQLKVKLDELLERQRKNDEKAMMAMKRKELYDRKHERKLEKLSRDILGVGTAGHPKNSTFSIGMNTSAKRKLTSTTSKTKV